MNQTDIFVFRNAYVSLSASVLRVCALVSECADTCANDLCSRPFICKDNPYPELYVFRCEERIATQAASLFTSITVPVRKVLFPSPKSN